MDLCSGLGGFSEAFIQRGHDVIRIDNDSKFKHIPNTLIANIRYLPLKRNLRPDILLMSPPCNCFSTITIYCYWDDHIPKNNKTVQALRIVGWCLDAVDYLKPKYWILENPRGMLRTILGKPKITTFHASWGGLYYKPTDLWGNIPPEIIWHRPQGWIKAPRNSGKSIKDKLKSEESAKIPYKLSEAICIAMEKTI